VKSGLVDMPRVSHYRLCAHLLMAFGTMAWLTWIALDLRNPTPSSAKSSLRTALRGFTALLVAQIAWGAFTAGLRAGYGYPTWPTMNGAWAPSPFWISSPSWASVLENPASVHFVHRWLGAAVGSFAVWLAVFGARYAHDARTRSALRLVGAVAAIQFVLGVVTVLTSVHLHVAVTHQVVGCLLLAAAVNAVHCTRKGSVEARG
jgi:cytochrome c oxidase assembly protein subunit 15